MIKYNIILNNFPFRNINIINFVNIRYWDNTMKVSELLKRSSKEMSQLQSSSSMTNL